MGRISLHLVTFVPTRISSEGYKVAKNTTGFTAFLTQESGFNKLSRLKNDLFSPAVRMIIYPVSMGFPVHELPLIFRAVGRNLPSSAMPQSVFDLAYII